VRQEIEKSINEGVSYEDLGFKLKGWIERSNTPFGEFVRSFCISTQPPLSAELCHERKGDLLPIHPAGLKPRVIGTDSAECSLGACSNLCPKLLLLLWLEQTYLCADCRSDH